MMAPFTEWQKEGCINELNCQLQNQSPSSLSFYAKATQNKALRLDKTTQDGRTACF
jgi:hypothetical protein